MNNTDINFHASQTEQMLAITRPIEPISFKSFPVIAFENLKSENKQPKINQMSLPKLSFEITL